ncbi:cysteine hydrolase family protein [Pseudolysinimonas yzui]|uniref:cysteine hydrolase family protein n=1 Tax=Pseudolysinimonas yzui TaxID=2708254 RepID=UPI00174A5207|nr:isochorismatase family cysteine hydrolase [Pseudolysinimonas yzui]
MSTWTDVDPHIAPELGRSALVVIDTQRDFVDGGASPVPGTTQVLPAIATLLQAYREAGRPIVHIVRLYDGDDVDLPRRNLIASGAPIVRPHTPGSQIVPDLLPPGAPELDPEVLLDGAAQLLGAQEWAIWKPRWGAFHRTALDEHLRGLDVTTIVLAGCNYPNCPRATAYGGSERDYRVLVVADAISGVRPDHLEEAGRIGVLAATTAVVTSELAATVAIAG